jgi:hypothetical protein
MAKMFIRDEEDRQGIKGIDWMLGVGSNSGSKLRTRIGVH